MESAIEKKGQLEIDIGGKGHLDWTLGWAIESKSKIRETRTARSTEHGQRE